MLLVLDGFTHLSVKRLAAMYPRAVYGHDFFFFLSWFFKRSGGRLHRPHGFMDSRHPVHFLMGLEY